MIYQSMNCNLEIRKRYKVPKLVVNDMNDTNT